MLWIDHGHSINFSINMNHIHAPDRPGVFVKPLYKVNMNHIHAPDRPGVLVQPLYKVNMNHIHRVDRAGLFKRVRESYPLEHLSILNNFEKPK